MDRIEDHVGRFGIVGEKFPSQGTHDRSASHLHNRDGKTKHQENERTEQHRSQQQEEGVNGDASREFGAGRFVAAGSHGQKYRRVAQRIHDRQQSADH